MSLQQRAKGIVRRRAMKRSCPYSAEEMKRREAVRKALSRLHVAQVSAGKEVGHPLFFRSGEVQLAWQMLRTAANALVNSADRNAP
jgi:hypothetical protein